MARTLTKLTNEKAEAAVTKAMAEGRYIRIPDLRASWRAEHTRANLRDCLRILQEIVTPDFVDAALRSPSLLALMVEALVHRFSQLVSAGEFNGALEKLSSLPVLYSPDAGVGARSWKDARNIFEAQGIGTNSLCAYKPMEAASARNRTWSNLAETALRIVSIAPHQIKHSVQHSSESLDSLRKRALASGSFEQKRKANAIPVKFRIFLLPDSSALHWHSWLDGCRNLDVESASTGEILDIVKHLVSDFFAVPDNPEADTLLEEFMRRPMSRPAAVREARRCILNAARASLERRRTLRG